MKNGSKFINRQKLETIFADTFIMTPIMIEFVNSYNRGILKNADVQDELRKSLKNVFKKSILKNTNKSDYAELSSKYIDTLSYTIPYLSIILGVKQGGVEYEFNKELDWNLFYDTLVFTVRSKFLGEKSVDEIVKSFKSILSNDSEIDDIDEYMIDVAKLVSTHFLLLSKSDTINV
jgi:hypothetical protein